MLIRRELAVDSAAIRRVHLAAFDRPALAGAEAPEARLVDALREDGDVVPALSLVAEHDGEVIGHVVCSRARIGGGRRLGSARSAFGRTGSAPGSAPP